MRKKILALVFLGTFFAALMPQILLAQNFEVREQRIYPDSKIYFLKRLKEKSLMFLKFSPETKANYYLVLLDNRLAEAKYIAEGKKIAFIEKVTSRYAATAGQLTSLASEKNMFDLSLVVSSRFENHQRILIELRDIYPDTTAEWRFLQDDINYLEIYKEQLPQRD